MNTYEVIIENLNEELAKAHKRILELEGQVQWYVTKVAEGHFGGPGLKGYQELGERCAKLHNALDDARAQLRTALAVIEAMKE